MSGIYYPAPAIAPGISGLEASSVGVNEIVVSPGWCTLNINGVLRAVRLTESLTKSIASNWAAGNFAGGLASGVRATNTTYWIHLIFNPNTNAVDLLFSASIIAADRPTGWFASPILLFKTESGNSNIRLFRQRGDTVYWQAPTTDFNGTLSTSTSNLLTLNLPTGIELEVFGVAGTSTAGTAGSIFIGHPLDTAVGVSARSGANTQGSAYRNEFCAVTDSLARVKCYSETAGTGGLVINKGFRLSRMQNLI